ncbi:hypothetical protein AKJ61_02065 [candidate division MSBL1 archaeon SCGC-AAA259B11]|uniref:Uncharacterized protein n=1 Tax=candidate division MSBL1 archaeon SCGC-AAA259B11 TaxID=1698260 RepID=A0A133U6M1_9EURY|nr:hypothetical protein AKJ61_02065 [candidate division MSBL1 archaeon SCGC-AAA259B11]
MFEAEETARVDAPRDLVWEWITDLGNFASQIPNATVVENGEREVTIRDSFHWVNFPPEIGEVDLKISKIEESDKVMRIKGGNRILGTQTMVKVEGREKDGTKVHIQSKWWLRGRAGTAFEWILRTTVLPIRLLKRQQERQIEGTKSGTEKHLADYWKKQEKKAEVRKEFLNTLLRQDLRSKFQTIQGYLQLLDEVDLPDEHREYLRKAVKAGGEADEILELGRKLEEIGETERKATGGRPGLGSHPAKSDARARFERARRPERRSFPLPSLSHSLSLFTGLLGRKARNRTRVFDTCRIKPRGKKIRQTPDAKGKK